ncbi:MAG: prepilin-type N-terminal cleavage/methylation domain-containing protein [Candidatus Riflebacteria bacterium]|nr:prepilin-type N-terminal cleavage/methylation domain-containing protein [Candidatus Riflebacteria bacterium]
MLKSNLERLTENNLQNCPFSTIARIFSSMIPKRTFRNRQRAFTLLELIITLAIFVSIASILYDFVWHYFRSYVQVDEKIENEAETWQIVNSLQTDLSFCDFPDGTPQTWEGLLATTSTGFRINKQKSGVRIPVEYKYDRVRGDLFKEEDGRNYSITRNRLKNFLVEMKVEKPEGREIPAKIWFHLVIEPGKIGTSSVPLGTFVYETQIFPYFINKKLNSKFWETGIPR